VNKFLLISYAFPPMGVVGSIRPYKVCRHLPSRGWVPIVLTSYPRQGLYLDHTLLEKIPKGVRIYRAKYINVVQSYQKLKEKWLKGCGRQEANERLLPMFGSEVDKEARFSFKRKLKRAFLSFFSTPDHQVFWNIAVLKTGTRILRRNSDIRLIMTTSPPHSSQMGGALLARMFNKPYIVDFRDPWWDIAKNRYGCVRSRLEKKLESIIIRGAEFVVSSTECYSRELAKRYGSIGKGKFITIRNSFEPELFEQIGVRKRRKFTLCYLGILYPEYNPYVFFEALAEWLTNDSNARENTEVLLVGTVDSVTSRVIKKLNLKDVVRILPRMSHDEAISQAKSSDMLLMLLGCDKKVPKGCVPSKLYEYLGCKRPILALVPEGEAANIVRQTQTGYVVSSDDKAKMKEILTREFNRKWQAKRKSENNFEPDELEIEKYTTEHAMDQFAKLFNSI